MKTMLIALVTMASVAATASQYVTVRVCDRGESGTQCETVTYAVRASDGVSEEASNSSSEHMVQAPARYGVPAWLRTLNRMHSRGHYGNNPSNPGFEAP
jgi:hypothetical protein